MRQVWEGRNASEWREEPSDSMKNHTEDKAHAIANFIFHEIGANGLRRWLSRQEFHRSKYAETGFSIPKWVFITDDEEATRLFFDYRKQPPTAEHIKASLTPHTAQEFKVARLLAEKYPKTFLEHTSDILSGGASLLIAISIIRTALGRTEGAWDTGEPSKLPGLLRRIATETKRLDYDDEIVLPPDDVSEFIDTLVSRSAPPQPNILWDDFWETPIDAGVHTVVWTNVFNSLFRQGFTPFSTCVDIRSATHSSTLMLAKANEMESDDVSCARLLLDELFKHQQSAFEQKHENFTLRHVCFSILRNEDWQHVLEMTGTDIRDPDIWKPIFLSSPIDFLIRKDMDSWHDTPWTHETIDAMVDTIPRSDLASFYESDGGRMKDMFLKMKIETRILSNENKTPRRNDISI